jgi:SPP1 gp7 family putative phage head morphogenesis protein
MKLFGYELKLSKSPTARAASPSSPWQLRPNDGQGAYSKYFQSFVPRKIEASFYEFLREAIPIIDAGINKLVNLEGHLEVEGDDAALVDEIQEWLYNVPVNDLQKGLHAFHQNFTAEAFEQGFAIGEFVTDKKRTDIVSLRVADSKYIKFKRSETGIEIYQKADGDNQDRKLTSDNLLYFSINNENQNPYGVPLVRSCEFVSKILATMHNSLANVWERFGDPSFSIIYKTSKRDGVDLASRRQTIEDEFNTAIRAKREGKSADFVRAIDMNSDIKIDIIGAADQLLEFEVPVRHVQEQIIAKIGLPPWMLGMHWSTTERLSDNEAEILLADIATRQAAKMPYFYNLIRTLLLLRGRTWEKGDWKLKWAQVSLKDILKQAQARFMNAQADMYYLQNASAAGIEINITDLAIGKCSKDNSTTTLNSRRTITKIPALKVRGGQGELCACGEVHSNKELSRPTPWPELDKTEYEYENELKYEWNELKKRVMLILKLNDITPPPSASTLKISGGGNYEFCKEDTPGLESFVFSEEQRALIMQSMKDMIGTFDIKDENSAVRWYYGQAYSLGLIQAVKLIGKERPILDIIKNQEIYNDLCKNGFQLLKDIITQGITGKMLPKIQAYVIAGYNPLQVADRLKKFFGDQNASWERLARTEMASAAERAKLDEWQAWDVRKVEFVPAPDGCPICFALAGPYPIGQCPIPGTGTHPRCRCSIAPVMD